MITVHPYNLTVPHGELPGSPREFVSDELGGVRVVRRVTCAWADRHNLAQQFLGYRQVMGANVVEHLPHNWPAISGSVIVTAVAIDPFSPKIKATLADVRFAEYDTAVLTVTYTIPQIRTSEAYGGMIQIRETFQGASEFITLPKKNLFWDVGVNKEPIDDFDAPGKISQVTEWTYNISGARIVPPEVDVYPGKTNLYSVISASTGRTFPAQAVLCGNPTISREERFDGSTLDVTLRFLIKNNGTAALPKGWNYFPRPSKTGASISWERMTDGTDNKDIYDPVDFGDIIV